MDNQEISLVPLASQYHCFCISYEAYCCVGRVLLLKKENVCFGKKHLQKYFSRQPDKFCHFGFLFPDIALVFPTYLGTSIKLRRSIKYRKSVFCSHTDVLSLVHYSKFEKLLLEVSNYVMYFHISLLLFLQCVGAFVVALSSSNLKI